MPDSDSTELIYRDIPDFPGYRAASDGSIWSCWSNTGIRPGRWKRLTPSAGRRGTYLRLRMTRNGRIVTRSVHRLVLLAFVGPCPEGMQCMHLDNDPQNNRPGNLAWGSAAENNSHKIRRGTLLHGSGHVNAKLNEERVEAAKVLRDAGWTLKRIGALFGVCEATISLAVRGENWRRLSLPADIKTTVEYYANTDQAVEEAVLGKRPGVAHNGEVARPAED